MHETFAPVTMPTSKQGARVSLHCCLLGRKWGKERASPPESQIAEAEQELTPRSADLTSTLNHP